jgi:ADP-ribosylglycohydrolase
MDSIRGGYLGFCLGDVLGSIYNGDPDKYSGKIDRNLTVGTRKYNSFQGPPGQITDKTAFMTALLCHIRGDNAWVKENVVSEYIAVSNNYHYFLSENNKKLFHGITRVSGFDNRWKTYVDDGTIVGCQSNNSLTRVFPFAILLLTQPDKVLYYAVEDTRLTNPNEINIDATVTYVRLMNLILTKKPIQEGLQHLYTSSSTAVIKSAIAQAINNQVRSIDQQKSWVSHSIYMAVKTWILIAALPETNNRFEEVMKWVITRGGDSNSNAAICGAIAGLIIGESRLMNEAVTKQNLQIIMSSNPSLGHFNYNARYHPTSGLNCL